MPQRAVGTGGEDLQASILVDHRSGVPREVAAEACPIRPSTVRRDLGDVPERVIEAQPEDFQPAILIDHHSRIAEGGSA